MPFTASACALMVAGAAGSLCRSLVLPHREAKVNQAPDQPGVTLIWAIFLTDFAARFCTKLGRVPGWRSFAPACNTRVVQQGLARALAVFLVIPLLLLAATPALAQSAIAWSRR